MICNLSHAALERAPHTHLVLFFTETGYKGKTVRVQIMTASWDARLNSNLAGDNFANETKTKKRTPLEVLRDDEVDPPIHAEYFHSVGATTQSFIVNEANIMSSFVMRSIISWNMVVPLDKRLWRTTPCGCTRHISCCPGWRCRETWREKHFHAMETFSADSDEVSVWELKGLLLVKFPRVVIHANVVQYLFDNWNKIPLCGGNERVHLLSEDLRQILCKITGEWSQRRRAT